MNGTALLSADAKIAELEMEIARQNRLQNYFSALASECNARFAQINVFETACVERLEVIERQAEIIKKLEAAAAERDAMIARLSEEKGLLRSRCDQIENSFSWRITVPLRILVRAVRKSIKGLKDARNGAKF
jgi:hypothetical protein